MNAQGANSTSAVLLAVFGVLAVCLSSPFLDATLAAEEVPAANPTVAEKVDGSGKPVASPAANGPRTFPLTVTGKALDPDGKPIAGATIFLVSKSGMGKQLGRVTTGPDGSYQFHDAPLPIPTNKDKRALETASLQIFGTAPGRAFAWRGVKRIYLDARFRDPNMSKPQNFFEEGFWPDEAIQLDLPFASVRSIRGRVVDERGRAVQGVKVSILNCDYLDTDGKESHVNSREFHLGPSGDLIPTEIRAISDNEGRFAFESVPPEVVCWIRAEHPKYAPIYFYTTTSNNPPQTHDDGHPVQLNPVELTLEEPRIVSLQVVGADNQQPIASVRVHGSTSRANGYWSSDSTNNKGRARLKLPPGQYQLCADPPRGANYIRTLGEIVVEKGDGEQMIRFEAKPGCTVIFKALDAGTGKGIAGVSFRSERERVHSVNWFIDEPTSDAQGEMRAVVEPGTLLYAVSQLPDGYAEDDNREATAGRTLELPESGTVTAEFLLHKPPQP
jgi:protocatechuate 3,4-dioxygenase beta subunit